MRILNLGLGLLLSVSAIAQSEMKLEAFDKIEMDAPIKLQLLKGSESSIKTSGSLANYRVSVNNMVLEIGLKEGKETNGEPLQLSFKEIKSIRLNGACAIEMAEGTSIEGSMVTLDFNGAAKANLNLKVERAFLKLNGASKATLLGEAQNLEADLKGATKFYGSDLKTANAQVKASGASYFSINAKERMAIEASGACKGVYAGNPEIKTINVSGAADIVDANSGKRLADDRENPGDTTRIKIGKKKIIIVEGDDNIVIEKDGEEDDDEDDDVLSENNSSLKKVYAGFELGMGALTTNELNFQMPADYKFLESNMSKSWFYGLNLLEGDLVLVKNRLAITSGLGMEFQNIEFSGDQILKPNVNILTADSADRTLTRNRMYCYNLNVPLMLKFAPRTQTERNGFHIAAGVIGGFKAYNHLRIESSASGYQEEAKLKDDFNVNPFRLTATVRVGYGWFRAFVNYSLTPFFSTSNTNPDIRNFAAGITVIPFNY